jgi:hypothetical protein
MAAGDLTDLDSVRAYLRGSVPVPQDDDTLLGGLITAVSHAFVAQAGRNPINATYTDTVDGEGGCKLFLEQYPVASVTSVTVDGVVIPPRATVGGAGWVLSNAAAGKLEVVGYTFADGVANCVIVYVAGYGATTPEDVAQACIDQVGFLYRGRERIGISNETMPHGSVTYAGTWEAQQGKGGETPLFASTVERYRLRG